MKLGSHNTLTDRQTHTHTHTHMRARAHSHTHTHIHTHTHTHTHMYARTHAPHPPPTPKHRGRGRGELSSPQPGTTSRRPCAQTPCCRRIPSACETGPACTRRRQGDRPTQLQPRLGSGSRSRSRTMTSRSCLCHYEKSKRVAVAASVVVSEYGLSGTEPYSASQLPTVRV